MLQLMSCASEVWFHEEQNQAFVDEVVANNRVFAAGPCELSARSGYVCSLMLSD